MRTLRIHATLLFSLFVLSCGDTGGLLGDAGQAGGSSDLGTVGNDVGLDGPDVPQPVDSQVTDDVPGPAPCETADDCADVKKPCTKAVCTSGLCEAVPDDGGTCDDGNPCTADDACKSGECVSGANICACKEDADCTAQDDGDLCNGTLVCKDNACVADPATAVTCDPSGDTECEKATCDPASGECKPSNVVDGTACDDGDACTIADSCKDGQCASAALACDDGDACTDDACKDGECQYTPNTAPCDDGNPCTEGDQCEDGGCKPGESTCPCMVDTDCGVGAVVDLCGGKLVCKDQQCVIDPETVVLCDTSADTTCTTT